MMKLFFKQIFNDHKSIFVLATIVFVQFFMPLFFYGIYLTWLLGVLIAAIINTTLFLKFFEEYWKDKFDYVLWGYIFFIVPSILIATSLVYWVWHIDKRWNDETFVFSALIPLLATILVSVIVIKKTPLQWLDQFCDFSQLTRNSKILIIAIPFPLGVAVMFICLIVMEFFIRELGILHYFDNWQNEYLFIGLPTFVSMVISGLLAATLTANRLKKYNPDHISDSKELVRSIDFIYEYIKKPVFSFYQTIKITVLDMKKGTVFALLFTGVVGYVLYSVQANWQQQQQALIYQMQELQRQTARATKRADAAERRAAEVERLAAEAERRATTPNTRAASKKNHNIVPGDVLYMAKYGVSGFFSPGTRVVVEQVKGNQIKVRNPRNYETSWHHYSDLKTGGKARLDSSQKKWGIGLGILGAMWCKSQGTC